MLTKSNGNDCRCEICRRYIMPNNNIWTDQWESMGDEHWQGGTRSPPLPRGKLIGASLMELPPGAEGAPFH
ncbi:MAG: hypothetical protein CMQ05_17225 [Gammaproteobacteria bacterium]|nr:hypothetical protein [Gammaproteobacteria bacterium]